MHCGVLCLLGDWFVGRAWMVDRRGEVCGLAGCELVQTGLTLMQGIVLCGREPRWRVYLGLEGGCVVVRIHTPCYPVLWYQREEERGHITCAQGCRSGGYLPIPEREVCKSIIHSPLYIHPYPFIMYPLYLYLRCLGRVILNTRIYPLQAYAVAGFIEHGCRATNHSVPQGPEAKSLWQLAEHRTLVYSGTCWSSDHSKHSPRTVASTLPRSKHLWKESPHPP